MAKYIILSFISFLFLFYVPPIIYFATKGKFFRFFYHDVLKWHIPDDSQSFDGASFCSKCKLCDKEILQDSQGNWFEPH